MRRCAFATLVFFLPFSIFAQTASKTNSNTKQTTNNVGDSPISILIILDTSASMRNTPKLNKVLLESLSDFVGQSHKSNEYFIVGISTVPKLLLDASTDIEATQKAISKIKGQKPEGASAFYDACFWGVKKLSQGQHSQKIIFILSDGIDTISEKTLDELLASLKDEKVVIYAVNVNSQENKISSRGDKDLEKITSTTGGAVYKARKTEEVESIFDTIRGKLRH
jgi:VWFA-related protein